MNGYNKLECYIKLDWSDLTGPNTLAYWAHSKVTKKIDCCVFGPLLMKKKCFIAMANAIKLFTIVIYKILQ